MLKKRIISVIAITFLLSVTSLAISESDVQAYVDANGREAVSGNLFIWFLCAIAFLKVSQKIDSFMASLGINTGRTGGSMLGELMIAGRAVTGAIGKGSFGRSGGSSPPTSASSSPASPLQGGLVGTVGRGIQSGAVSNITAKTGSSLVGGIMSSIGGKVLQNSLSRGGDYANNVISTVAKGNINQTGTITGDRAAAALKSYMGVSGMRGMTGAPGNDAFSQTSATETLNRKSDAPTAGIPQANSFSSAITASPEATAMQGGIEGANAGMYTSSKSTEIPASPQHIAAPNFSDVEIGGGRISGFETPADGGEARQFAMYSTEHYSTPEGNYDTVSTVDGSQWYRQYAQPAVEKTPYSNSNGDIRYNERLIQKMPPVPRRKDKL